MSHARTLRPARSAFTMVELLVVIAIIAVLVALTTAAVQKVRVAAVTMQASTDIKEMQSGLKAGMKKYGDATVLPSRLVLYNDLSKYSSATASALDKRSADALRKMFGPRFLQTLNASGTPLGAPFWTATGRTGWMGWDNSGVLTNSFILEGQQCIVFYLGGVQTSAASGATIARKCSGFSTNPLNPMDLTVGARNGPFFEFKSSRLVPANAAGFGGNAFFVYLDPYNTPGDPSSQPYAYFSSTAAINTYNPYFTSTSTSDCASLSIWPYFDSVANQYVNPDSFQVISAGADGIFSVGGGPPSAGGVPPFTSSVYNPGTGATDIPTRDNLANFSRSVLAGPVNN